MFTHDDIERLAGLQGPEFTPDGVFPRKDKFRWYPPYQRAQVGSDLHLGGKDRLEGYGQADAGFGDRLVLLLAWSHSGQAEEVDIVPPGQLAGEIENPHLSLIH